MPAGYTREEHMTWAKQRAFEYIDRGECAQAIASFGSDMNKHDETRDNLVVSTLLAHAMVNGDWENPDKLRRLIDGFQ